VPTKKRDNSDQALHLLDLGSLCGVPGAIDIVGTPHWLSQ
jgi:hypothetical protein